MSFLLLILQAVFFYVFGFVMGIICRSSRKNDSKCESYEDIIKMEG